MAQISKKYFDGGETTSAADATAAYSSVETASGSLDQDNTRNEWVSHYHLSYNADITEYAQGIEDAAHGTTYDSAIWVSVDQTPGGGAQVILSPAVTLNEGDVMRIHVNTYVTDVTNTNRQTDYYWYRLISNMSIDGAANADVQLGLNWGHSITNGDRGEVQAYTHQTFEYQRQALSWLHICENTTELINTVELETKIEDIANDYTISHASMYVIIQRR